MDFGLLAAQTGSINLGWWDLVVFTAFMVTVIGISLYASRKESSSEDYFLAGRGLTFYLIGFSLLASNISTEHFVGMSGKAFGPTGMAVANWEWMSAICMVFIAWWLLPKFIKAGIYTMPQYLEFRYDGQTRTILAGLNVVSFIIAVLGTVLLTGSIAMNTIFEIPELFVAKFGMTNEQAEFWAQTVCIWSIGIIAGAYTIYGGLKAVVWSDFLQGGALIIGGAIVAVLATMKLGDGNFIQGWQNFITQTPDRLHVLKPANDDYAPWVGTIIGGLWILNLHYWGLNQYITQRTLGAKSLAEGQKGVIFGAALKLLIPLIIVVPGIMAFQIYGGQIDKPDEAYSYMIAKILPPSLRGIIFAALAGAVMSTFNSGLNSAATVFTIDFYTKFFNPKATPKKEVLVGRITTAIMIVIACFWTMLVASQFESAFEYIQEMWSFVAGAIVAVFIYGMVLKKAPPLAAKGSLILGPILYGLIRYTHYLVPGLDSSSNLYAALVKFNNISFLYHQMIVFALLTIYYIIVTVKKPLSEPVLLPVANKVETTNHPKLYLLGGIVIALTILLYVYFETIAGSSSPEAASTVVEVGSSVTDAALGAVQ